MHRKLRVLFIVKERVVYGDRTKSYGLVNSCALVAKALVRSGIQAETVQVVDNNDIDREVTKFKPTHCVIEALWVVPEKFEVLSALHPEVQWIIRLHSQVPFLATEGISMEWIHGYLELLNDGINIRVACNNVECLNDLSQAFEDIKYLPNVYFQEDAPVPELDIKRRPNELHVGAFGALRPLKNHLKMAFAALQYTQERGKRLVFHINTSAYETASTGSVLKNLRALFSHTQHQLVEHEWSSHSDFLSVVKSMDLGLQVSFTESFNIVSGDFVACGVPVVVSNDIDWMPDMAKASPTSTDSVTSTIADVLALKFIATRLNKRYLKKYSDRSLETWLRFLKA